MKKAERAYKVRAEPQPQKKEDNRIYKSNLKKETEPVKKPEEKPYKPRVDPPKKKSHPERKYEPRANQP